MENKEIQDKIRVELAEKIIEFNDLASEAIKEIDRLIKENNRELLYIYISFGCTFILLILLVIWLSNK